MALLPGTRLGPYEILTTLGGGGMGDVYRARDSRLGRDVALKVLRDDLTIDRDRLSRFEQEARAASALNHPNIVTVFDFDPGEEGDDGRPTYLAMELVEGQSLRDLAAAGQLPVRRVLPLAAQIAEGLAAAHERGIVHRDLKLENVMVSREGRVKILDFGLAKVLAETVPMTDATRPLATRPGMLWGTPGYMAPEQILGEAIDYRADHFALGVILYQLLAGCRPFAGIDPFAEMSAVLNDDPPPLVDAAPGVPDQLAWVIERLLAKDRRDRYDSTRDLARELARLRDTPSRGSGSGNRPSTPQRAGRHGVGGLALPVALTALLALGLGGVGGWWLSRGAEDPPPRLRILTYSGSDAAPDLSPDRRVMAFTSERDGRRRIWLKQLASGAEAPLTAGVDDAPRFSPDGGSVLFSRLEGDGRALWRIAVVGGEERRLLADAFAGDWSPDGSEIAFVRKLDDRQWVLGIAGEGGGERELVRVEANDMGPPAWSPDGSQIVVSHGVALSGAPSQLHFVDVASGSDRVIPSGPLLGPATAPAWLTDSSAVIVPQADAVRAFHGALARLTPDGQRRPLFWSLAVGSAAAIAGENAVIFDAATVRSNLHEVPLGGGGADRWLTRGHALDRQPRYSPDGRRLVFSSNRSGNLDIWELDLVTGALRRLTDSPGEDWDPAYVGDGSRIVWSSARSGNFEIWIAGADGSAPRQVTADGVAAENPTTTPDGSWIVYVSLNPAKRGIWRIRPDGSDATHLVPGDYGLPEVSPDGRHVLYRTAPSPTGFGIEVVRIDDGSRVPGFAVNRLATPGAGRGIVQGRARWLPDGSAIAFVASAPEPGEDDDGSSRSLDLERTTLWLQELAPGRDTSTTLRPFDGLDPGWEVESFAFSPDGSRLILASGEPASNLVIAEGVPGVR